MADNIIGLGFDINKFSAEKKLIYEGLMEIYEKGKQIGSTLIPIGSSGGFAELTAKVQAQAKAIEELQAANLKYAQTQQTVNAGNKAQVAGITEVTTALNNDTVALTANVEERRRLQNSLESYKASQKEDRELLRAGTITRKEYNDRIIDSSIKVEQYKNKISELDKTIKQQTQTQKSANDATIAAGAAQTKSARELQAINDKQAKILQASIDRQKKGIADLGNDYKQLSAAYNDATLRAKNYNLQLGASHPLTIAATEDANKLGNKLKEIDSSVGQNQRNVGNYAEGVAKGTDKMSNGLTKALSTLRYISYVLPGIGLAGLLAFAVEPIIDFVTWIFKASDATLKLEKQQKDLADVYEMAGKNAGSQIAQLRALQSIITDQSRPLKERNEALNQYNEIADESLKLDAKNIDQTSELNQLIQSQIALIEKRSLSKAFENKLGDVAAKIVEFQIKLNTDSNANQESVADLEAKVYKARATNANNYFELLDKLRKRKIGILLERPDLAQGLKDAQEEFDLLLNAGKQFITLDKLKDATTKSGSSKRGAVEKEATKEMLDAEFELYKIAQQRKLSFIAEQLKDTKKDLGQRLILADMYFNAQNELAERTSKHEIQIQQDKLKVLHANLAKENDAAFADNKDLADKLSKAKTEDDKQAVKDEISNLKISSSNKAASIIADIKNVNSKIKIERGKLNDDLIGIEIANQKQLTQIEQDEETKRLDFIKKSEEGIKNVRSVAQGAINADAALRTATLDKQLHDGLIDQKEYAKQKAKIENDSLVLSLTVQKKEAEGLRAIAVLRGEDLTALDNTIAELTGKLQSAILAGEPDPKKKQRFKDHINEYLQIEQAAEQTVVSLIDAKYNREIENIDKLIAKNNERHDAEVDNISKSTLSAQEKAAQLIILDKQTAANNAKLAKEQLAIKRKQAIFDRDAGLLQIAINTAVNITKAGFNPYLIAFAIAEGLAQAAAVLAKPLPSYAEGTLDHPGGPAKVHPNELVIEPGGKKWRTPNAAETFIPDLAKHARVIPLGDDINHAMHSSMITGTALLLQQPVKEDKLMKELVYSVQAGNRMVAQAIRKQKPSQPIINIHGSWGAKIDREVRN